MIGIALDIVAFVIIGWFAVWIVAIGFLALFGLVTRTEKKD